MNSVETIWRECSTELRRFILKRISDETVAEDILQEVFVKIQAQIGTLRDVRKVQHWLYQITRNTIIDYYRSRKPTEKLPETLKSSEDSNVGEIIAHTPLCIKSMVDRLPDKYRQAVILTAYQGLTQKEMGEKLGISLSGAKSRVQRAREKLKNMLLACCHFELDRSGRVVDYKPRHHPSSKHQHETVTELKST